MPTSRTASPSLPILLHETLLCAQFAERGVQRGSSYKSTRRGHLQQAVGIARVARYRERSITTRESDELFSVHTRCTRANTPERLSSG